MFAFIRNWFGKNGEKKPSLEDLKNEIQEESSIDAEELNEKEAEFEGAVAEEEAKAKSSELVHTELSLHPFWEQTLDDEKKYTLRFLQEALPPLPRGTISVTGFSMIPQEKGMTVALFFRNATPHPVRIKRIRLAIFLDDKPFARMRVDMSDMDAIPPFSSRPWEVMFPKESYLHDNLSFTRWKVVMKAGKSTHIWPNTLELDPEMEKRMTERQKDRLETLVHKLPPIPVNTVHVTGFDIGKTKNGQLVAALLFRNGLNRVYNPKTLRITISDMEGNVVAKGRMEGDKIRVQPGNSRPWLVVFPPEAVLKPDADLRRWLLKVE